MSTQNTTAIAQPKINDETKKIGLFYGDGRAQEVAEFVSIIASTVNEYQNKEALSVETLPYNADYYLKHGQSWPDSTPKALKENFDSFALTALGDSRVPGTMAHAKPIILDFLRGNAYSDSPDSLFTNYNRRPCKLWHPSLAKDPVSENFGFKLHVIPESGFRVEEIVSKEHPNEQVLVQEYHSVNSYIELVDKVAQKALDKGESIAVVLKSNVYTFAHLPVEKALKERYAEENDAYAKAGKQSFLKFYNADAFCFEMVDHPERMPTHIVTDPVFGRLLKSGIASLNSGTLAKTPSDFYAEIGRESVSGQYISAGEIIDAGQNQVGMQKHLHTERLIKANLRRAAEITVAQGWIEMSVIHNGDIYPKTANLLERCAKQIGQEHAVLINFISAEEFFRQCVADPEMLNQGVFTGDNLLGDIASDTLAARSGGLGCAPSLSETTEGVRGSERNVYVEPVHGTAPNLPRNVINPTGMIASMGLLLEHYHFNREADALKSAISETIGVGLKTADMPIREFNTKTTTDIFGSTVITRMKQKLGTWKLDKFIP
jgi:isocitrate/isopropylmalate dehydrogenase